MNTAFSNNCTGGYRFTFNGMEKDDEVKGTGNSLNFGARIYDPRLGKWLSLDPKTGQYVPNSPYSFAINNPVYFIDDNGMEIVDPATGEVVTVTFNPGSAPTFTTASGTVSNKFIRQSTPIINNLSDSEVGRQLVTEMMDSPTKIELGVGGYENVRGSSNIIPEYNSKGEVKLNRDGLYKKVKIKVNLEALAQYAKDYEVDANEALVGVMTVEVGHLSSPEQIQADLALQDDNYGDPVQASSAEDLNDRIDRRQSLGKQAYEGLVNGAAINQIEYRVEKGQNVDRSTFMILDGIKERNPRAFGTIKSNSEAEKTYSENGGR